MRSQLKKSETQAREVYAKETGKLKESFPTVMRGRVAVPSLATLQAAAAVLIKSSPDAAGGSSGRGGLDGFKVPCDDSDGEDVSLMTP